METLKQLGENVTEEWLVEGALIRFHLPNSARKTVDIYIETNLRVLREWDNTKTLHTVQDISTAGVEFTPYLRSRLDEVSELIAERQITVKSAIVIKNDFVGQLMRVFGRIFTARALYLTQVFFTDMDKAVTWINSQLKTTSTV